MIEDCRNSGDEARRRSQDESDADEEEKGKGSYLYGLGDSQLDGLKQTRKDEFSGKMPPYIRVLLD